MANFDRRSGNVSVHCPDCEGALTKYVHQRCKGWKVGVRWFQPYQCLGCSRMGVGVFHLSPGGNPVQETWLERHPVLADFYPEDVDYLPLPENVPQGIQNEFREGEDNLAHGCIRSAAGMFRSVLDKTLKANGYQPRWDVSLKKQIDQAAGDGIIHEVRRKKAHDDIRVLGNDVLHDEWHEIPREDVEKARHYMQRILEDFYDDRETVVHLLKKANRLSN